MSWRSSMSSKDILRTPMDQLCLLCHDDFSKESPGNEGLWIHGPVAGGWCVMCHDPHASPYQSLLLERSIVNICSGCHRVEDLVAVTPEHRQEDAPGGDETGDQDLELKEAGEVEKAIRVVEDCTGCHDPHRGSDRRMLRADYKTRDFSRDLGSNVSPDGQKQTHMLDEL